MAPYPTANSSGLNTPESELESVLPVHPTAARRPNPIVVQSEQTAYSDEYITSSFTNRGAAVTVTDGQYLVTPTAQQYELQTARKVAKTGLMMVGWGGNNGTTLSATILANRHNIVWHTKSGVQQPNYIGSLLRASTVRLGSDPSTGKDVHVPVSDVLPMVHPNDLVLGGWDISGARMDEAMKRAQVLDWDLQRQVMPHMAALGKPLPSIYYPDFTATNQEARADHAIPGKDKQANLEHLRADASKAKHRLDRAFVSWTEHPMLHSHPCPRPTRSAPRPGASGVVCCTYTARP
ncbi:hypothetical protein EVJ58_g3753 [Rhodofomes roseus]|uniref:Inositol-3-phosphate synthase n=1 Tax=Rhodofomes roseus TaxID=34475 RepID=A0A4Y9YNP5_9APHY|nr:hypothetical protein EVJ58_g3753 [Rhodofomes roseus]